MTARHESLMQHSNDVTVVTAEDTTMTRQPGAGPGARPGHPAVAEAPAGRSRPPRGPRSLLAAARSVVSSGSIGEVRARFRHHHGHHRHVAALLKDARHDNAVGGLVWNLRDVTKEALLAERLRHQAFHDHLTGLANRALFLERLEVTLAQVGPQRPVAVCLVDLDKLKEANDRYGHQAGDALLKVVGQRFRAAVRPGDVVARLGGDEFGVLFEGVDAARPTPPRSA